MFILPNYTFIIVLFFIHIFFWIQNSKGIVEEEEEEGDEDHDNAENV